MMGEMRRHTLWGEPWVGTLFGHFYYDQDEQRRHNPQFSSWDATGLARLRPRTFVLNAATATFPNLKKDDYLIIKEPNGSIGAPLMMEALPESRMILLVRDPWDVIASFLDARREGGWNYERNKGKAPGGAARSRRRKVQSRSPKSARKKYLIGMGNAKEGLRRPPRDPKS